MLRMCNAALCRAHVCSSVRSSQLRGELAHTRYAEWGPVTLLWCHDGTWHGLSVMVSPWSHRRRIVWQHSGMAAWASLRCSRH